MYAEIYDNGNSIVKIEDDAGNIVARYEVTAIRLEIPRGYVKPACSDRPIRIETFRN